MDRLAEHHLEATDPLAALAMPDPPEATPDRHDQSFAPAHPLRSVEELLAAKGTKPIRSLDDLAADTFESDQELNEFLAFNHAERHREVSSDTGEPAAAKNWPTGFPESPCYPETRQSPQPVPLNNRPPTLRDGLGGSRGGASGGRLCR